MHGSDGDAQASRTRSTSRGGVGALASSVGVEFVQDQELQPLSLAASPTSGQRCDHAVGEG